MPIINEIKQAPGLSRTVNTDTGIYMIEDGANLREFQFYFKVYDESTVISFCVLQDWKTNEEKKTNDVRSSLDTIHFDGAPQRSSYKKILKRLLEKCGHGFRRSERIFGYTETVTVEINENIENKIVNWERGNT